MHVHGLLTSVAVIALVVTFVAAAAPTLSFQQQSPAFIYSNNPEQAFETELCDRDKGHVAIHGQDVAVPGEYRLFWEYLNQLECPLGFAIVITNLDPVSDLGVLVHGLGHCEDWGCGGDAISTVFNTFDPQPEKLLVGPGEDLILLKLNDSQRVRRGTITTGFADVTLIGGGAKGATVRHLMYCDWKKCDLHAPGQTYITRLEADGEIEGRMYKGVGPTSRAVASDVKIVIPPETATGAVLPVQYKRFNTTSKMWSAGPIESPFFITNIVPTKIPEAVASDIVPMAVPGWGWINGLGCCDACGKVPNVDNWGVEYEVSGSIVNQDTVDHTLTIHFNWYECDSIAAFKNPATGLWQGIWVSNTTVVEYVNTPVLAGQTVDFSGNYMLGGPACGGIKHTLIVL